MKKFSDEWWDDYWKDEPVFTIGRCLGETERDYHSMRCGWIRDIEHEYKDTPEHWTKQAKIDMINAGHDVLIAREKKWYEERIVIRQSASGEFQKMKRHIQQSSDGDVNDGEIWRLLICRNCTSDITCEQHVSQMGKCDNCLKKHIAKAG